MAAPFEDSPYCNLPTSSPWSLKQDPGGSVRSISTRCCSASALSTSALRLLTRWLNVIIAQLLYLEREDRDRDISLYINSPGGYIASGLAISTR